MHVRVCVTISTSPSTKPRISQRFSAAEPDKSAAPKRQPATGHTRALNPAKTRQSFRYVNLGRVFGNQSLL